MPGFGYAAGLLDLRANLRREFKLGALQKIIERATACQGMQRRQDRGHVRQRADDCIRAAAEDSGRHFGKRGDLLFDEAQSTVGQV